MTLSGELSINSTEPTSSEGKENLVRFSSRLDYEAVIACPNERANVKKEAWNVASPQRHKEGRASHNLSPHGVLFARIFAELEQDWISRAVDLVVSGHVHNFFSSAERDALSKNTSVVVSVCSRM